MCPLTLQNEEEFSKKLEEAHRVFLQNLKLKTNKEFIEELKFSHEYFFNQDTSEGITEIKSRVNEITEIIHNKKIMLYNQEGYSYLRPFEDCYQDAIDFFNTDIGERVKQVFFYFGYKYKVPKSQMGGYNIDKDYKEGNT
jgi:glycyl-tRNA synthetase beta subunit